MWFTSRLLLILGMLWLASGCALLDAFNANKEEVELDNSLENISVELKKESEALTQESPKAATNEEPDPALAVEYKNDEHRQQASAALDDFKRAVRDLKKGNLDLAYERFETIHTSYPQLVTPVINMSIILRKQKKYDDALAALLTAQTLAPEDPNLLNELGVVNRYLGQFADAKSNYQSAISIDVNFAKAHYNLGVLADLYLHDPELALTEFKIYQTLLAEPDKTVAGWIAELERRTKSNQP